MDIADNTEFRQRLVLLAEVFDVKLSPQRQALYFEALRDVPFEDVIHGLNQAVRQCKFLPRPAEIRTLALGDADDAIEAAWLSMRKAFSSIGSYASLVTTDAALGETILAMFGSWPAACASELTPEMWASKRKEFGRIYRVMLNRTLDGPRLLPGICETSNRGRDAWKKYTTIGMIDGPEVKRLEGREAEHYLMLTAATANSFNQLRDLAPAVIAQIATTPFPEAS